MKTLFLAALCLTLSTQLYAGVGTYCGLVEKSDLKGHLEIEDKLFWVKFTPEIIKSAADLLKVQVGKCVCIKGEMISAKVRLEIVEDGEVSIMDTPVNSFESVKTVTARPDEACDEFRDSGPRKSSVNDPNRGGEKIIPAKFIRRSRDLTRAKNI